MNLEEMRMHILSLEHVTEDMPFDDTTLVFRIGNKMFALLSLDSDPPRINLKCDPERAIRLREDLNCIIPGYHMSKKHWNTMIMDDDATWSLFQELVAHSYDLVYKTLPKKLREELQ